MDSNFRFRARMATVPSLRALSISLKLSGFRRRTCRPQGPKFRIHFPPAKSLQTISSSAAELSSEIQDFGRFEPHDAYEARLRREHGRKSSFWSLID